MDLPLIISLTLLFFQHFLIQPYILRVSELKISSSIFRTNFPLNYKLLFFKLRKQINIKYYNRIYFFKILRNTYKYIISLNLKFFKFKTQNFTLFLQHLPHLFSQILYLQLKTQNLLLILISKHYLLT